MAAPPSVPILVVDNDEVAAMHAKQTLEAAGFSVTCAASPAEATQLIDVVVPRLVVLDLGMPDEGSFHLLLGLRNKPMWRDVPIIVVGSVQRIEDVQRAIQLGASDCITKPINANALIERIQRRIRGRS